MKTLHVQSWDAYEKAMREAVHRTAIDVGANNGGYTRTLLDNGFHVLAFEPVPEMYQELWQSVAGNPNVSTYQLGLGDRRQVLEDVQVLECWTIGKPGMGGLEVKPEYRNHHPFDMTIVTIDEMVGDTPIGIIKLDVDGYEHRVWRGGVRTISRWKPAILCEFGCYLHKIGDDPKAFVDDIFSMGYKVVSMDGKNVFRSWKEIEPQWPYHSTFDVMLLPE